MPTYDYECQKCGLVFEKFQSMKDEPLKVCATPECGGAVKRLIGTGAGIIFKGSGFYETDYRSKEYKDQARKETTTSTPSTDNAKCNKCDSPSPACSASKSE